MSSSRDQRRVLSLYGAPEATLSGASDPENLRPSRRRLATLYDAVAGKVSHSQGPRAQDTENISHSSRTIKHSIKDTPLAPDEVLFRRKDAPDRFIEHDIYQAHEQDLPSGGQGVLPDSDLLKAIHAYTSRFYTAKRRGSHTDGDWDVNERSMDETALLALGVLLEEAGREVLGRRGDLVFVEGVEDAAGGDEVARDDSRVVGHQDVGLRRGPKRRKVASTADDEETEGGRCAVRGEER